MLDLAEILARAVLVAQELDVLAKKFGQWLGRGLNLRIRGEDARPLPLFFLDDLGQLLLRDALVGSVEREPGVARIAIKAVLPRP